MDQGDTGSLAADQNRRDTQRSGASLATPGSCLGLAEESSPEILPASLHKELAKRDFNKEFAEVTKGQRGIARKEERIRKNSRYDRGATFANVRCCSLSFAVVR